MKINSENLKRRVKEPVDFLYYTDGCLYYRCRADSYTFIVPIQDTKNTEGNQPIFNATDKGIFFMRWIRKEMERELEISDI